MKFKNDISLVPYEIRDIGTTGFYSRLEETAEIVLENSVRDLSQIIKDKVRPEDKNESKQKIIILESLIVGVLWLSHAEKVNTTKDSALNELNYLVKVVNSHSSTTILKKAYYNFRNYQLTQNSFNRVYPLELSLEAFRKFIAWLKATQEYKYEVLVIEDWLKYWERKGESKFLYDMNSILRVTINFETSCNSLLAIDFNKEHFEKSISGISKSREDYFQITKPLLEYYLNGIGAVWMNELNDEDFNSKKEKLILAPGCMRINGGINCVAIAEGEFLRCSKCSETCNVNSLVCKGEQNGFDVLIAQHQSSIKKENTQLKNKAVVGIACMSGLISGGLMLLSKGIHAKCTILNKSGCKSHWTKEGLSTDINFSELKSVIKNQSPSFCNKSDS